MRCRLRVSFLSFLWATAHIVPIQYGFRYIFGPYSKVNHYNENSSISMYIFSEFFWCFLSLCTQILSPHSLNVVSHHFDAYLIEIDRILTSCSDRLHCVVYIRTSATFFTASHGIQSSRKEKCRNIVAVSPPIQIIRRKYPRKWTAVECDERSNYTRWTLYVFYLRKKIRAASPVSIPGDSNRFRNFNRATKVINVCFAIMTQIFE